MATKKREPEGIETLQAKLDPCELPDMTLLDFMAAMALLGSSTMNHPDEAAREAYLQGMAMMKERQKWL